MMSFMHNLTIHPSLHRKLRSIPMAPFLMIEPVMPMADRNVVADKRVKQGRGRIRNTI